MSVIYLNADTGSDTTGTGAIGAPYATFAKALTVYSASDTIYFQNSTANYSFLTATIDKNCTITGQSITGVVLNGAGGNPQWTMRNATIAVSNITFYNAYTIGSGSYGMFSPSANTSTTNISFTDCIFRDLHLASHVLAGIFSQLALGASTTTTITVDRCRFIRIETVGTSSTFLGFRTGVSTATENFTMRDCTVDFKATLTGQFYYLDNLAGGTVNQTIKNCIFTVRSGNMNWRTIFGSSTFTCTYTHIYGVTSVHSSITSQTGVTQVDPLMVDPDNENYYLRQTSTAIGSGGA